jgi:hypothetical protein
VGCAHAVGCPLFPLLKLSLKGWRDYYCDSDDRWRECARYQLAQSGERVPISLLPNGASARHLEDMAGTDRSGTDRPGTGRSATGRSDNDRLVTDRPDADRPAVVGPGQVSWQAPRSRPTQDAPPAPAPRPAPADRPARHARKAPSPRRGWWARFADWMKGPA